MQFLYCGANNAMIGLRQQNYSDVHKNCTFEKSHIQYKDKGMEKEKSIYTNVKILTQTYMEKRHCFLKYFSANSIKKSITGTRTIAFVSVF